MTEPAQDPQHPETPEWVVNERQTRGAEPDAGPDAADDTASSPDVEPEPEDD